MLLLNCPKEDKISKEGLSVLLDKVEIRDKVSVEEIRTLSRLSQKEFAQKVGLAYSTYVKKERGETDFFANEINRISLTFHIPMDKIVM